MKVYWEVDDGYTGPSRPQYTVIDDEDLADFETEQEREDFIADEIQRAFDEKITWYELRREAQP